MYTDAISVLFFMVYTISNIKIQFLCVLFEYVNFDFMVPDDILFDCLGFIVPSTIFHRYQDIWIIPKTLPVNIQPVLRTARDSNPRSPACQASALPMSFGGWLTHDILWRSKAVYCSCNNDCHNHILITTSMKIGKSKDEPLF